MPLVSSLLGAASLGILNIFALYNYAVGYGARLPVEGVPFLGVAVGVSYLCLSLVVLFGFLFVFYFYRYLTKLCQKAYSHPNKTLLGWIVNKLPTAVLMAMTFAGIWSLDDSNVYGMALFGLLMNYVALSLLFSLSGHSWVPSITTTVLFAGFVLFNLFSIENYASFLRTIKYGGGIPVALELADDSRGSIQPEVGYLFLQTSRNFIMLSELKDQRLFYEIPTEKVDSVRYYQSGLPVLPEAIGSLYDLLKHLWIRGINASEDYQEKQESGNKQRMDILREIE